MRPYAPYAPAFNYKDARSSSLLYGPYQDGDDDAVRGNIFKPYIEEGEESRMTPKKADGRRHGALLDAA